MPAMKKLFLFTLLSFAAYSQVQIQVVDPDVDPASFEREGYQVQSKPSHYNVIPEMDKRDTLFQGVKLPAKWDQLDKDIFYMDLKSKSMDQLKLKYPNLSEKLLKDLKAKGG
jgi:hypothetical protein